jgi:hypothetical protein
MEARGSGGGGGGTTRGVELEEARSSAARARAGWPPMERGAGDRAAEGGEGGAEGKETMRRTAALV